MIRVLFALLMSLLWLGSWSHAETSYRDKVVIVNIAEDSLSNSQSFEFMKRVLSRAEAEQAKAVLFNLNTPGGLAWETSELMLKAIEPLKIPTIAYVNQKAMSAGALIAASCDTIYMAPLSSIGAAGLVSGSGQEIEPMMRKKLESAFGSFVRAVVEEKGHNVALIEAMMIPSDQDREFGSVKVKKDSLLTLTGKEAASLDAQGKPLLAKGLAKNVEDILAQEKIDAPVIEAQPTGFEQIALWIAWLSPILILLGIAGIYFEMKTPGFGIGGIIAICAFALFFFGNNVAGNLAGYEMLGLFILGVIFIILEIVVLPGFFIFATLGGICILISLFGGMINAADFERILETGDWSFENLYDLIIYPALNLSLGMLGGIILIAIMMRYLPDSIIMRRVLNASTSGGARGEAVDLGNIHVGDIGIATTELKPNGKAFIHDRLCEVFSRQGILKKGTPVRVVDVRAFDFVVEEQKDSPTQSSNHIEQ